MVVHAASIHAKKLDANGGAIEDGSNEDLAVSLASRLMFVVSTSQYDSFC